MQIFNVKGIKMFRINTARISPEAPGGIIISELDSKVSEVSLWDQDYRFSTSKNPLLPYCIIPGFQLPTLNWGTGSLETGKPDGIIKL